MKQVRIDVTLRQLLSLKNQINMNPAYQRDYIAKDDLPWQQKLMGNIIKGDTIIPSLYIRTKMDLSNLPSKLPQKLIKEIIDSLYEMVDGQQRTRTVWDFDDGLFNLGVLSKYSSSVGTEDVFVDTLTGDSIEELKSEKVEIYKDYLDYPFSIVATNGTDPEVYDLFVDLNDLNQMSHQEKRQARLVEIAKWIRNQSRLGIPNKEKPLTVHKLFKREDNLKGTYLDFSFKRMAQDETLAKMVAIIDGVAFRRGVVKKSLDDLYKRSDFNSKFVLNLKVKRVLDKLYVMLEDKTHYKGLTVGILLNLTLVVNELLFDKSIKVKSWKKVGEWFFDTHELLCTLTAAEKLSGFAETIYHLKTRLGSDGESLDIRLSYLKLSGMYDIDGLQVVDPKRVITDGELRSLWFIANKKCQKCGEDVKLHDAIKAHKEAHSNGGPTTIQNSYVSCGDCNIPEVVNVELEEELV